MAHIHPSSVVDPKAELADDVEIGPFCTVGPNVKIGAGTRLISHVVVDGYTTMGERNLVYPFAALGCLAQHKRSNAPDAVLVIGNDNTFREHVTAHVGSDVDHKITTIGNRNLFLVASHIAHDCVLGDDIVMSNNVMLAGHVHVESKATIGGGAGVLQFTRIGEGAMIGGLAGVTQDVIPYGLVFPGNRAALVGINQIGLKRAGVPQEQIDVLRKAYRVLFNRESNLVFADRIAELEKDSTYLENPLVQKVIPFLKNPSKHGILQPE